MKSKSWYRLGTVLIIYWLFSFILLVAASLKTHGHFGYPLDDTYIHMAIGKHFQMGGFWGVSLTGFSSSTSSPLWTTLIVLAYGLFGVNDWVPVVLGILSGTFTIIYCYFLLRKSLSSLRLILFLVLIVVLTPLPVLALTGMEHLLHALITLSLSYCAATFLSAKEFKSRQFTFLLILSALAPLIRYEGLFLVFTIGLLLLTSKRFTLALFVGGAGLLPITGYGLYSISKGWYFLPNSILLKGNLPDLSSGGTLDFLSQLPLNLISAPHLLTLIIACLVVYVWCEDRGIIGARERYLTGILIILTLLHLQFASIGWFYRYEAYLVLVGTVILIDMLNSLLRSLPTGKNIAVNRNYLAAVLLATLLVLPMAYRADNAFRDYPVAVMNIYEQQYQMGLFLKTYYEGKSVAANDIGAINYLSNVKVVDLFGLGTLEVVIARRDGQFNKSMIDDLVKSKDVRIVIIYDKWFEGIVPSQWIEIGNWQISDNVVCGDNTVSFYAPSADWQDETIANLKSFSDQLPKTVTQSGKYTHSQ